MGLLIKKAQPGKRTVPAQHKLPKSMQQPADPSDTLFRGEQKSLWIFPKHGVTSSFLNSFITCREQTRLHYVEGWASYSVPLAFEFGTCGHWIIEKAYERFMKLKRIPTLEDVKSLVLEYEKLWLTQVVAPTSKQLEQQELVYGMAEGVLPAYFVRWEGDFTGKYKYANSTTRPVRWHSLEEVFEVPYTYPDGLVVPIRGRRDGVFVDKNGKLWVFDTKCRSVINHEDACDTLPFDLQQMLYLWITHEQMKKEGLAVAGTVMNILRRPGQRQLKDEVLSSFLSRIAKEVGNPKNYDHYFVRYEMAVTAGEVAKWKKETLDPIMQEVRGWWEGTVPHYMNHNALISKYGHCSMYLPIVKDTFSNCYRRKACFSELETA